MSQTMWEKSDEKNSIFTKKYCKKAANTYVEILSILRRPLLDKKESLPAELNMDEKRRITHIVLSSFFSELGKLAFDQLVDEAKKDKDIGLKEVFMDFDNELVTSLAVIFLLKIKDKYILIDPDLDCSPCVQISDELVS